MGDPDSTHPVEQLFHAVADLDEPARTRILETVDPQVAAEVRAYLNAERQEPDFLTNPVEIFALDVDARSGSDIAASPTETALAMGTTVSGYTIEGPLGAGSSGEVYLARQQRPNRKVALKVLRSELFSTRMVQRFEREAEVLAGLQHPGIAQIYEVGTLPVGACQLPFLAMEHVAGALSLTAWAITTNLDATGRIDLFLSVCRAVEHAHGRGAIHRDLKPANILVGPDGDPRVIDFGLARVVDPLGSGDSQDGQFVGTPQYMSPEQCAGSSTGFDVRSDIYSLGVVLYELLANHPPHQLRDRSLTEIVRIIREVEPTRPPGLATDVWTILRKALAKDPDRRYRTVTELADDLAAYRAGEPIRARSPSAGYRLRLFARRHKSAVVISGISLALGLVGLGFIIALYIDNLGTLAELRQTRSAELRQRSAIAVARADLRTLESRLDEALGRVDPNATVGAGEFVASIAAAARDTEIDEERRVLVGAAINTLRRLEASAAGDPELRRTLAEAYSKVGNLHGVEWSAQPIDVRSSVIAFERSVALWRDVVANHSRPSTESSDRHSLVEATLRLAEALRKADRLDESIATATTALDLAEQSSESDPDDLSARLHAMDALLVRGDARIPLANPQAGAADSRRAVEIGEDLLREGLPNNAQREIAVLARLAAAHFRLAIWLGRRGLGTPVAAVTHAERANALRQRASAAAPERIDLLVDFLTFLGPEFENLEFADRTTEVPDRVADYLETARARISAGAPRDVVRWFVHWRHFEAKARLAAEDRPGVLRLAARLEGSLAAQSQAVRDDAVIEPQVDAIRAMRALAEGEVPQRK